MKHENPTVNYVPRNPLWDIFMSRANASALHIIAPPTDVFFAQYPANDSALTSSLHQRAHRPEVRACASRQSLEIYT